MTTERPGPETLINRGARAAWRRLDRAERRIVSATEEANDARQELSLLHQKACERFGRDIPADAFLLDVLELIDIQPGDVWRWRGRRNNKSSATILIAANEGRQRGEKSLVRFLAIAFGIITEDDYGLLYPTGDPDDVNPWHRDLRRTEAPMGNPKRWSFVPGAES